MDRRIRKTRKNILNSFIQLLDEKPINEIKAQEIAELADISRSTFYQHYTDVYDLLDQAEDAIFDEITTMLQDYSYEMIKNDPLLLFTELFYFFKQNSKICVVLLNKNGSITTGQRISKVIEEKFYHEWEALFGYSDKTVSHYLSQYIITGFVGVLQSWIAGGLKESEEAMALIARVFIHNSLGSGDSVKANVFSE